MDTSRWLLVCYKFKSGWIRNRIITLTILIEEMPIFYETPKEKDNANLHIDLPKMKMKNLDNIYATYYNLIARFGVTVSNLYFASKIFLFVLTVEWGVKLQIL